VNYVMDGFLKAAGVKRLGRLLAAVTKLERPELEGPVHRASHALARRAEGVAQRVADSTPRASNPMTRGIAYGMKDAPDMIGRVHGFHGTSGSMKSIQRTGLRATHLRGGRSGSFFKAEDPKLWLTQDKGEAQDYAHRGVVNVHARTWGRGAIPEHGQYVPESSSLLVKGNVSRNFVKGSPHFQPMTGREVVRYAKTHPERVQAGLRRLTQKP